MTEAHKQQPKNDELRCEEAFYRLFSVQPGDRAQLLECVASLLRLPAAIRKGVAELENADTKLLLRWAPKAEAAFSSLQLSTPYKHFLAHFDGLTMYGMEVCSDALSRSMSEKVLTDEEIQDLTVDIHRLKEKVANDESLPPVVRIFLLRHLHTFEIAVREFRISGTIPLEQATNAFIGAMMLDRATAESVGKTEAGRETFDVFSKALLILNATWAAMQIGERAGTWFGQLTGS